MANNSVMTRVGSKFHKVLEEIKVERIKKGVSVNFISTEKITNLIIKHKDAWEKIKTDIINLNDKEIEEKWI